MQFPQTLTIASSGTTSTPLDIAEQVMNLLDFPAMTGTSWGFQVLVGVSETQPDAADARWKTVYDTAGAALSYTLPDPTGSGGVVSFDWSIVFGSRWVRLTVDSQAAAREITVFTQQIG